MAEFTPAQRKEIEAIVNKRIETALEGLELSYDPMELTHGFNPDTIG